MRRREFIALVGGAAAAWPLTARAQQRAFPVVGLLSSRSPAVDTPLIAVIRQSLNETGFVEGQNVALDYRWASIRSTGRARRRSRASASGRHCYNGWRHNGPGGQGGDRDHTDRLRGRRRPAQNGPRYQPAASWRQHHGCELVTCRDGGKAARAAA